MIHLSCPGCQKRYRCPESAAGKKFDCACGQRVPIPAPSALPPDKTVLGAADQFAAVELSRAHQDPMPRPSPPPIPEFAKRDDDSDDHWDQDDRDDDREYED